jgi:hypothetical protein
MCLLDLTDAEETFCSTISAPGISHDHGIIVQAMLPQHGQTTEIFMTGNIDVDTVVHSMDLLNEAHKDICLLLEQCLVRNVFKASRRSIKKSDKE